MGPTTGDNTVVTVINGPGNQQASGIAAQAITFTAALITVGLRLLARRLAGIKLGWDDWLVILAMLVGIADFGVICWWYALGGGKYIGEVTPARLHQLIVVILLVELFWATILFLVRASALILWYQIFPQPWVKKFCRVWRILNLLFWISSVLITCLQCNPPWLFFYPLEAPPGSCLGTERPYTALGVISIVFDAVVIALPTALVLRLQLTRAMKLTVCALILTGSLTIIFTIIRIVVLRRSDLTGAGALNVTWVYAEVGYWIGAESYIAIVSACLPCLRPVLSRVVPRCWVPKSLTQTGAYTSTSASRSGTQRRSGMRMSAMQRGASESRDASRAGSGVAGLSPGPKRWAQSVSESSSSSSSSGRQSTSKPEPAARRGDAATRGSNHGDAAVLLSVPAPLPARDRIHVSRSVQISVSSDARDEPRSDQVEESRRGRHHQGW